LALKSTLKIDWYFITCFVSKTIVQSQGKKWGKQRAEKDQPSGAHYTWKKENIIRG
jgi:hypothetical protein